MPFKEKISPTSFDTKEFGYNVTPIRIKQSNYPTSLQKLNDPIRKLEMLDDEDLWKRVEVGARFFVSHSPHSYRLNTAENIIRVGRLSVAGWQDDLVAQEFGVGRIVVRQSRKI